MPECQRCGQCCIFTTLVLNQMTPENDQMDMEKWMNAHYLKTAWLADEEGKPGGLAVRVPLVCQYLDFDNTINQAHCIIFDSPDRPRLCREWFCAKTKASLEQKNVITET